MDEVTLISVHARRTDYEGMLNAFNMTLPDENYYESAFKYYSDR